MGMIDTALESLDVLFFDDKILGTTGVQCVFVIFHLWVRVKKILFKNSIGTHGTQNYSSGKV